MSKNNIMPKRFLSICFNVAFIPLCLFRLAISASFVSFIVYGFREPKIKEQKEKII